MACAGDVPTLETLAAVDLLREHLPDLKVRVVNVVDLMTLQPPSEHPHGLTDKDFDALFTTDKPIIFAFHGYPWLIHRLTYRRTNHDNLHVRGYKEEGTTTTPFDMVVLNDLDRFHLVGRRDRPRARASARDGAYVKQALRDKLIEHKQYIHRYGEDMPEVRDWRWEASRRTGARDGDGTQVFSTTWTSARQVIERPATRLFRPVRRSACAEPPRRSFNPAGAACSSASSSRREARPGSPAGNGDSESPGPSMFVASLSNAVDPMLQSGTRRGHRRVHPGRHDSIGRRSTRRESDRRDGSEGARSGRTAGLFSRWQMPRAAGRLGSEDRPATRRHGGVQWTWHRRTFWVSSTIGRRRRSAREHPDRNTNAQMGSWRTSSLAFWVAARRLRRRTRWGFGPTRRPRPGSSPFSARLAHRSSCARWAFHRLADVG